MQLRVTQPYNTWIGYTYATDEVQGGSKFLLKTVRVHAFEFVVEWDSK